MIGSHAGAADAARGTSRAASLSGRRRGARQLWLTIHLYLGLGAGALFAMLGITGSILVFGERIDTLLNPQVAASRTSDRVARTDDVVAAVEGLYGRKPYYLEAPTHGGPYIAFVRPDGRDEVRAIRVDPATAVILADRRWGGYFVSFVRELHAKLFLARAGEYILGAVSVLALISILTGLYLWWPRAGAVRRALTFRPQANPTAFSFELHRVAGFYLASVLFVLALTGTYLALPQVFTAAVGLFSHVTAEPDELTREPLAGARPLSLTQMQRFVDQHTPGAVITGYQLPEDGEPYLIYYRDPAEPHSQYGRSTLWIDAHDGKVLDARPYVHLSAADRFLRSQVLLHNGQLLGRAGQWLVFAAGLAVVVMYGTGFYLWWSRRRRSRPAAVSDR